MKITKKQRKVARNFNQLNFRASSIAHKLNESEISELKLYAKKPNELLDLVRKETLLEYAKQGAMYYRLLEALATEYNKIRHGLTSKFDIGALNENMQNIELLLQENDEIVKTLRNKNINESVLYDYAQLMESSKERKEDGEMPPLKDLDLDELDVDLSDDELENDVEDEDLSDLSDEKEDGKEEEDKEEELDDDEIDIKSISIKVTDINKVKNGLIEAGIPEDAISVQNVEDNEDVKNAKKGDVEVDSEYAEILKDFLEGFGIDLEEMLGVTIVNDEDEDGDDDEEEDPEDIDDVDFDFDDDFDDDIFDLSDDDDDKE